MKKVLLLFIAMVITLGLSAQINHAIPHQKSSLKVLKPTVRIDGTEIPGSSVVNHTVATKATLEDPILMETRYDLQTNSALQNRVVRYPDGTMGATVMMALLDAFTDRGTGYNYFDGTEWDAPPSARIESVKTGWPSYAAWGASGEIVLAHQSGTLPLIVSRRATKGTGAWTQSELGPPAGASGILWPRMVTNGPDNMYVHVIGLTAPTGNGGVVWNDMDGALVYCRSLDGGDTWEDWQQLEGMTSAEYLSFGGDAYAWAEPVGETICFVVGDSWNDEFIMKSTDNGVNWTKTIIWTCPFNLWAGGDTTGRFNCSDGVSHVALDKYGNAHVVFGFMIADGDEAGSKYWVPWTDGLIYWNESMPELPQELDWDWLVNNGNMIAWVQDTAVWENETTQLAYYYCSMSSLAAIVVDDWDNVFVTWSEVTNLKDQYDFLLRHVYARASTDLGVTWRDNMLDLTADFLYTWSECVYAFPAAASDDYLYILFQDDLEAGTYLKGSQGAQGQTSIDDNNMTFLTASKIDIIDPDVSVQEKSQTTLMVAQNYPNPAHGNTLINVKVNNPGTLSLELYSLVGQKVFDIQKGFVNAGNYQFTVDASQLPSGICFYTVKVNNESVTHKMIVR